MTLEKAIEHNDEIEKLLTAAPEWNDLADAQMDSWKINALAQLRDRELEDWKAENAILGKRQEEFLEEAQKGKRGGRK